MHKALPRYLASRLCLVALCSIALVLGTTQCSSNPSQQTNATAKPAAVSVTTYHYDNARSGIQPAETTLTPANVNATSFGKLFSVAVDGQVFAHPLIAGNITMADGQLHNLLFVATENDTVYAFDADKAASASTPFWKVSLLGPGETAVPAVSVNSLDIIPVVGITGTPVLDMTKKVLYVVSKSVAGSTYHQRLHALNFLDGSEAMNGPAEIAASVPGTASEAVNGQVLFDPLRESQRAALALNNGTVWVASASHTDTQPYHGWLLGYDSSDLTKQTYVFNDTPNGAEGGIWMAAGGPSFDSAGNIYVASGNGDFNPATSNYSSAALKLTPGASSQLTVADYFSPFDQEYLSSIDADFGVSGMVVLPDQVGTYPHLIVTADKNSVIYLLNRDNLGKYNSTTNNVVQAFPASTAGLKQSVLFFNNTLYVSGDGAPMYAYPYNPTTQQFSTTASSTTSTSFTCTNGCYVGGSAPIVSANGSSDAILWTIDNSALTVPGPAVLRAYDPANLATELYDSTQATGNRDQAGNALKFTSPIIANGRVYVAGNGSVTVYGLLSTATQ